MGTRIERAASAIERHGILLVFPIENRPEPRSLWSELHPRTAMRWAWDETGDRRVVELWHLREELARSRRVVYAKWFRGRATFFARDVYRAMLVTLHAEGDVTRGLGPVARRLLDVLEDDSPQATKRLRAAADLQGRANEAAFNRGLAELWSRLLLVGVGEVEEGGFPSLAVGATRTLAEDLWPTSPVVDADAAALLARTFERAPLFGRAFEKTRAALSR